MDGEEGDTELRQRFDAIGDGIADVVQLQVQKDLLALADE
jgi:hypothetical protein